jgi:hypothetical protein
MYVGRYACVYVCIYTTTCPSLAPELLNRLQASSVFKGLSIIGRCPVNMSILEPKIGALEMGLEITMSIFSKIASTILNKFQRLLDTIVPNKSASVISSQK